MNITLTRERLKPVSVHVPKHLKPVSEDQFGHYLAGFIDGDGVFNHKQELILVFNWLDLSLAYYIKKRLGFGKIKKVKDKSAILLIISSKKGLEKAIKLINGKIRTENKLYQINNNILNHAKYAEFRKTIILGLNSNKDFKNHWLAGFSDAYANFQIKVAPALAAPGARAEVILNFKINIAPYQTLLFIKDFLGGNIGFIKSQDNYSYNSTSFGSAKNVINYFDSFHLLSNKHINYLKWRKAYLIIQTQSKASHLNKEEVDKIIKLKNTMNTRQNTRSTP